MLWIKSGTKILAIGQAVVTGDKRVTVSFNESTNLYELTIKVSPAMVERYCKNYRTNLLQKAKLKDSGNYSLLVDLRERKINATILVKVVAKAKNESHNNVTTGPKYTVTAGSDLTVPAGSSHSVTAEIGNPTTTELKSNVAGSTPTLPPGYLAAMDGQHRSPFHAALNEQQPKQGRCPNGYYQCNSGHCLETNRWCDSRTDCPDHDDETMCRHKPHSSKLLM